MRSSKAKIVFRGEILSQARKIMDKFSDFHKNFKHFCRLIFNLLFVVKFIPIKYLYLIGGMEKSSKNGSQLLEAIWKSNFQKPHDLLVYAHLELGTIKNYHGWIIRIVLNSNTWNAIFISDSKCNAYSFDEFLPEWYQSK